MEGVVCLRCGKAANSRCGRCKSAYFCGPECQRESWKTHKDVCVPFLEMVPPPLAEVENQAAPSADELLAAAEREVARLREVKREEEERLARVKAAQEAEAIDREQRRIKWEQEKKEMIAKARAESEARNAELLRLASLPKPVKSAEELAAEGKSRMAFDYYCNNMLEEAVDHFQDTLETFDLPTAALMLANVLNELRRFGEARREFERCKHVMGSEFGKALFDLAQTLRLVVQERAVALFAYAASEGHEGAQSELKGYLLAKPAVALLGVAELNMGSVMAYVCELNLIDLNVPVGEEGARNVLEFAEHEKLNEAAEELWNRFAKTASRVLLVGTSGSGKTHLRHDLVDRSRQGSSSAGEAPLPTDILDVESDQLLEYWDFSSEDYNAPIHRAVIQAVRPSVIVVCVDARMEVEVLVRNVGAWIESVRSASTREVLSPMGVPVVETAPLDVAFVCTHADQKDGIRNARDAVNTLLRKFDGAWLSAIRSNLNDDVWLRKLGDERFLHAALVSRCARHGRLFPHVALCNTYNAVRNGVDPKTRVTRLADIAHANIFQIEDHLMRLQLQGHIFYQPGTHVVATGLEAPMRLFKALLHLCRKPPTFAPFACEMNGWLGWSEAEARIEDRILSISWKGSASPHCVVPLIGCVVSRGVTNVPFILVRVQSGTGRQESSLRFSSESAAQAFERAAHQCRSLVETIRDTVSEAEIADTLDSLQVDDDRVRTLMESMLRERGLLRQCGDGLYFVPCVLPDTVQGSDILSLDWDDKQYAHRFARKHALIQAARVPVKSVAQALEMLVEWTRAESELFVLGRGFWRSGDTAGAWLHTEEAKVVCAVVVNHGGGGSNLFTLMAVRSRGQAAVQWVRLRDAFRDSVGRSCYVAENAAMIHPVNTRLEDWNLTSEANLGSHGSFLALFPERTLEAFNARESEDGGQEGADEDPSKKAPQKPITERSKALCAWCVDSALQCDHQWMLSAGEDVHFVATGYLGGGHVLLGRDRKGNSVAIKVSTNSATYIAETRALSELMGLSLRGARVVKLIYGPSSGEGVLSLGSRAAFVMDYVEGALPLRTFENEKDAKHVMRKIAQLLSVVHDLEVLHLDVRPDHILRGNDGTLVLVGFGFSASLGRVSSAVRPLVSDCPWTPPELVNVDWSSGKPVTAAGPKCDVYSLGMTMVQLCLGLTRDQLWHMRRSSEDVYLKLKHSRLQLPVDTITMIAAMCFDLPNQRPTMREVSEMMHEGYASSFSSHSEVSVSKEEYSRQGWFETQTRNSISVAEDVSLNLSEDKELIGLERADGSLLSDFD